MSFRKRALVCFVVTLCLMLTSGMRVLDISQREEYLNTAVKQATRRVDVYRPRGNIYDCNKHPLTGQTYETVTVVLPNEKGYIALNEMLSGEELLKAVESLKKYTPVTVRGKSLLNSSYCESFFVPRRYSVGMTHILGYLKGDGHGVTGVEKAMDELLYCEDNVGLRYYTDSLGKMLASEGVERIEPVHKNSVTLTVDSQIQFIVERAMNSVEKGAAVIIDAATGHIKAVVSRPDYDRESLEKYLDDESSPLINRAVCAYNVGSVFKPCLAVAALESGLSDYKYTCTGSVEVNGISFKCNRSLGHGELDLKEALAFSCNTYFYTLSQILGAERVYNAAKVFRFGESLDCDGGLISGGGRMPSLESILYSPAELTNLSIGQGDLLLSPIAVSLMYSAIVNQGKYLLPRLVLETQRDGKTKMSEPSLPTVAMSPDTAEIMKEYLKNALQNGTGSGAFVENVSAGGKTGTAQTGWKDKDRRILNGWFCGFYEGKRSNYTIVVLKEDVKSGSADCAPIFKKITENMKISGF